MLNNKPDLRLKPVNLVCTDLFRRHFLVYDVNFQKLGSVDRRKGLWIFTHAQSNETYLGYNKKDAVASWQRTFLPFGEDGKVVNEAIII